MFDSFNFKLLNVIDTFAQTYFYHKLI